MGREKRNSQEIKTAKASPGRSYLFTQPYGSGKACRMDQKKHLEASRKERELTSQVRSVRAGGRAERRGSLTHTEKAEDLRDPEKRAAQGNRFATSQ